MLGSYCITSGFFHGQFEYWYDLSSKSPVIYWFSNEGRAALSLKTCYICSVWARACQSLDKLQELLQLYNEKARDVTHGNQFYLRAHKLSEN